MVTPEEARRIAAMVREQCHKSIAFSTEYGTQSGKNATVHLRLRGHSKGDYRRLWGKAGGPRGRVVGFAGDWQVVAFDAHAVLAAVDKLEAATLPATPPAR